MRIKRSANRLSIFQNTGEFYFVKQIIESTALDDTSRLRELIVEALTLSDVLKRNDVGIHLDAALVALTGEGIAPPDL